MQPLSELPDPRPTPATPDDVTPLLDLRNDLARWLQGGGIRQWQEGEFGADRLSAWIEAGSVHVLRRQQRIVAAVAVLWDDPDIWGPEQPPAGYIHLLMVARDHAGQGIGDRMLTCAEAHIAAAGRPLARLDAVAGNARLQRWYADRGYLEVGDRTFEDGAWFSVTLREKRLR